MTTTMTTQPIRARRVRFQWDDTPLHWVPGDPQTAHTLNVMHLLLPAGERWFCDVYRQAVPLITDDKLREDVKGFIGQEAIHSRSHAAVLVHLADQGLDTEPYTRRIEWLFERVLGDEPFGRTLPRWARTPWLKQRLSIIAAIEHFTAVLGMWILVGSDALVEAGADPTMVDLGRWHGAEEVEHRCVAFDLFQHVSGSHLRRTESMVVSSLMLAFLWVRGVQYLMAADPTSPGAPTWRAYRRAARRGFLPSFRELVRPVPGYLDPGYHPSLHGDTAVALAYLATSPAARAAEAAARTGAGAAEPSAA